MKFKIANQLKVDTTEYPTLSIVICILLLLMSMFVTPYLCYVAVLICVYRIIRYDAKVFATDYCLMIPWSQLFRTTGGMALLIWLCLFAAIWHFVKGKIQGNGTLICVILLLNYLVARMQMNINVFVLCFGQIFLLYVLLPKQDERSALRTIRVFCWSLLVSSVCALVLRNTSQLAVVRGPEPAAYWGSTLKRFQGMFTDPNYYMTLLIVGIVLQVKLKMCDQISMARFLVVATVFSLLGILTYSKTFLLVFAVLVVLCIVWQFWNKKYVTACALTVVVTIVGAWLLLSPNSLISVVMYRLMSANTISELTTGRTDIYAEYWAATMENMSTAFWGVGLNAPMLRMDPHNMYLEAMYKTGIVGLVLLAAFFVSMARIVQRRAAETQNWMSKNIVLIIVFVVYFSLHGLTSMFSYASFFLAFLAIMLTKGKKGADW